MRHGKCPKTIQVLDEGQRPRHRRAASEFSVGLKCGHRGRRRLRARCW
jgi:hypothetical protein